MTDGVNEHSFAEAQARVIKAVEDQNYVIQEILRARLNGLKRGELSLEAAKELLRKRLPPFDRDMPTMKDILGAVYTKVSAEDRAVIASNFLVDKFPDHLSAVELRSATEAYIDEHGLGKIEAEALIEQIMLAMRLVSAPVPEVIQ